MAYFINRTCTRCGACLTECPTDSIIEGKELYVIDADTCQNHAVCVSVCPVNAIEMIPESSSTPKKQEKK